MKNSLEKELKRIEIEERGKSKVVLFVLIILLFIMGFYFSDYIELISPAYSEDINKTINISVFEVEEIEVIEEIVLEEPIIGAIKVNITKGYEENVFKNLFNPSELEIKKGDALEWYILDERRHKISCYSRNKNWRVFFSDDFYPGETVMYQFDLRGKYLCIDAIYGARGYISVK